MNIVFSTIIPAYRTLKGVADVTDGILSYDILNHDDPELSQDLDVKKHTVDLTELVSTMAVDHGCVAIGLLPNGGSVAQELTSITVQYLNAPNVTLPVTIGHVNHGLVTSRPSEIKSSMLADRTNILNAWAQITLSTEVPIALLLTPFAGCTLDDCTLVFYMNANRRSLSINSITVNDLPDIGRVPDYLASWMPIAIDGPATIPAGGSAEYVITAPANTSVFLETVNGYCANSRVQNGDTITVDAVGLQPGSKIRIKAGYRFWPVAGSAIIDVI